MEKYSPNHVRTKTIIAMADDPSTFEGLRPLLIIYILLSQNLLLASNILNEILWYNWHLVHHIFHSIYLCHIEY